MKTLLDDFGFKYDIAGNGNIAIGMLKNNMYDIVLMDLQMPEMNGFEAARFIRNQMNSKIPIIALTADVTTADLEKCKAVGMDDYISKPVDEKLLYKKIVDLIKKPLYLPCDETRDKKEEDKNQSVPTHGRTKCIDLSYLHKRTRANPDLMKEMISLYLDQTPTLIRTMKNSLQNKDWDSLYSAAHKIIPSFSIMGMHEDYENMAKKIQEYAITKVYLDKAEELILQLDTICSQACIELKEEYNLIEKNIK
jgi:CheY-like chemotaxis protein